MKKSVRVEYLFPNIADKRKYQYLENATLKPSIRKYYHQKGDSTCVNNANIGFTKDEFIELAQPEAPLKTGDSMDKYIEYQMQRYSIFSMHTNLVWNERALDKLAAFLANNPTTLPYFIEAQCLSIIGDFLNVHNFFEYTYDMECTARKWIWNSEEDNYNWSNHIAKYQLSIFLAVVDRLLAYGVNLGELCFDNLEESKTYSTLGKSAPWHEQLKYTIPNEGYYRVDGITIPRDEMLELLNFDSLDSFLDAVIKIVDIEHLYVYVENKMMDPLAIIPIAIKPDNAKSYPYEPEDAYIDVIPEDHRVDVKTCCKQFQKKLREMRHNTELLILNRKLEELKIEVGKADKTENFDWSILNAKFQEIYDEINKLPASARTPLLDNIERLTAMGKIEIKMPDRASDKQEDIELAVADLGRRMQIVEDGLKDSKKEIKILGERVDNLESALRGLYAFIDEGRPLPADIEKFLGKKNLIQVIKHPTKNKAATLRKSLILGALMLGSLPMLVSSQTKGDWDFGQANALVQEKQGAILERIIPKIDISLPTLDSTESKNDEEDREEAKMELYSAQTGLVSWYSSIYDKEPVGTTEKGGTIIRYYALKDGICIAKLDTASELARFLNEQRENVYALTWKAAVCSLSLENYSEYVDNGQPVPPEFTTFFIDYTPSIDLKFDNSTPKL